MAWITILIVKDYLDECAASSDWLRKWWPNLSFVSENWGSGCCVDIWEVDGPEEALAELPTAIVSTAPDAPTTDARNLRAEFPSFPENYFF